MFLSWAPPLHLRVVVPVLGQIRDCCASPLTATASSLPGPILPLDHTARFQIFCDFLSTGHQADLTAPSLTSHLCLPHEELLQSSHGLWAFRAPRVGGHCRLYLVGWAHAHV